MKTTVFFLTVIFAFPLFSYGKTQIDETPTDSLYAMVGQIYFTENGIPISFSPLELAFTGADIQSFDTTTREIVFTKINTDQFMGGWRALTIYLNDKPLLENIVITNDFLSWTINSLVFYGGGKVAYLNEGYPLELREGGIYGPGLTTDSCRTLRKEDAEKRKSGWDTFIQYLSDAGKIVGNTAIAKPPATSELNAISIYPNPTKGELRISNRELGIKDIQIFDVMGRRYSPPLEGPGEVNISYLPTGIYFVQIATEKGVVTKKIVKL